MFRPRTLKVRAQNGAEPRPLSASHHQGECLEKDRLEQQWEPGNNALWVETGRSVRIGWESLSDDPIRYARREATSVEAGTRSIAAFTSFAAATSASSAA